MASPQVFRPEDMASPSIHQPGRRLVIKAAEFFNTTGISLVSVLHFAMITLLFVKRVIGMDHRVIEIVS
jgi:hypothetical protein